MSSLAPQTDAFNFDRWPATLHPDHAERCFYPQRQASRLWVDGLRTRSGVPRWHRIRQCGDPVVVWCVDGSLSWQHQWCRDRACYACARSRSRKLGTSLRAAVEARPSASLFFVTLTRPRVRGESADDAMVGLMRSWEKLRHSATYKRDVVGGVRTVEVTHSQGHERAANRFAGWHAHLHVLLELRDGGVDAPCPACDGSRKRRDGFTCSTCCSKTTQSDGTMPAELRAVLLAWTSIVNGHVRAQCGVPLNRTNVGQLAKYLTKLWELEPSRARELFAAVVGKRIVEGFGEWRSYKRWGKVESTPHGWFASSVRLRDIEADPGARVDFVSKMPGVKLQPRSTCGAKRLKLTDAAAFAPTYVDGDGFRMQTGYAMPEQKRERDPVLSAMVRSALRESGTWQPLVAVASCSGRRVLEALRKDARPVWVRVDEKGPDHAARVASIARELRETARREYAYTLRIPDYPASWEH